MLIVSLLVVRASSPDPSTTFEDDDECVQKLRYIMTQGRGEGSARCLIEVLELVRVGEVVEVGEIVEVVLVVEVVEVVEGVRVVGVVQV